jgi:hypothetical protein
MAPDEEAMVRMPFGKYRGQWLCEVPDGYVEWLRRLDDLREPLRTEVAAEWTFRFATPATPSAAARQMADRLVQAGYRTLALDHHPDRGGDVGDMQTINAAVTLLRQLVRQQVSEGDSDA